MNTATLIRILKQYPIAIVAGLIAVVSGVLLFLRSPQVSQLESKLAELNKTVETIERNISRSTTLTDDIAEMDALVKKLDLFLVDPSKPVDQFKALVDLAQVTGVRHVGDPPQGIYFDPNAPDVETDIFPQTQYTFTVNGSLENVAYFLHYCTRGKPFMVVDSLDLTPQGNPEQRLVRLVARMQALSTTSR